jgi:hypothetical protein
MSYNSDAIQLAEAIRQNLEVLNTNLLAAKMMNMQVTLYANHATAKETRGIIKDAECIEFSSEIYILEQV